jgi:hypothetical protein
MPTFLLSCICGHVQRLEHKGVFTKLKLNGAGSARGVKKRKEDSGREGIKMGEERGTSAEGGCSVTFSC